jgi:hypothetical protein
MSTSGEPCQPSPADTLNATCFCISTDLGSLHAWLEQDLRARGLARPVLETQPHLFSNSPVFVAREQIEKMRAIVAAVECVAGNPEYAAHVLSAAPSVARQAPAVQGILQGYDFHLTTDGPRLIEINTNAGGALLNIELIRAQRACCASVAELMTGPNEADTEQRLFDMFLREWRRARSSAPLRRIAIVDREPEGQYLYPEFLLFQRMFESHGIATVVTEPGALAFDGVELRHATGPVDLVYNRLTDFYFEEPGCAALRAACLAGAIVTPNPHEHALYANKHNLAILTDAARLQQLGIDDATAATLLAGIPATESVVAAHADRLWAARDQLFFKPASGFGSRGSYRGAKLTRKVFAQILAGDYVAQALVPPPLRLHAADAPAPLKFDIRLYAHRGVPMLFAARLYQGQTTNFRTPGGGFAPVYYPPASGCCPAPD